LCIVHCALCIVHCALCIVHCALCIVHCALCIVGIVYCGYCIVHVWVCMCYCVFFLHVLHCENIVTCLTCVDEGHSLFLLFSSNSFSKLNKANILLNDVFLLELQLHLTTLLLPASFLLELELVMVVVVVVPGVVVDGIDSTTVSRDSDAFTLAVSNDDHSDPCPVSLKAYNSLTLLDEFWLLGNTESFMTMASEFSVAMGTCGVPSPRGCMTVDEEYALTLYMGFPDFRVFSVVFLGFGGGFSFWILGIAGRRFGFSTATTSTIS
jgi:hypothetical protein